MQLIDGKIVSQSIKDELKSNLKTLVDSGRRIPGLVTILVGENPASKVYINMKIKACSEIGMLSKIEKLDETTTENDLLALIDEYNQNASFDGILVQLPLPPHINEDNIIESILPEKDVDGFHPNSVGKLVIGKETFSPCTPGGILELLKYYKIETRGKHVVVVGRSNIVGKPVANMLVQKKEGANAVVTICHSAAEDLAKYTRDADILIAAIGRADFITGEMVKAGAVVIDVGINRVNDETRPKGYRITGDVDFESVSPIASFITPVPGGVGPMTIAMLLSNTYKSYILKEENNN